jgi:hypothetical protein
MSISNFVRETGFWVYEEKTDEETMESLYEFLYETKWGLVENIYFDQITAFESFEDFVKNNTLFSFRLKVWGLQDKTTIRVRTEPKSDMQQRFMHNIALVWWKANENSYINPYLLDFSKGEDE